MGHLALKNLKGRKAYSIIITIAVATAVVITLFTLFVTSGVRQGLENNRQMLGPDLAVVPTGSKEKGHIYLSKGPPAQAVLSAGILEQLGAFPELAAFSPQQRLGVATVGTVQVTLIAFDPATDFFVQPWLDKQNMEKFPGRDTGLVLGARVDGDGISAAIPAAEGKSMGGRLLATGTFMDAAIFIPKPRAELAAAPSWIPLKLRPGVSLDIMANRLEVNIAHTEVLRRPELFKTINHQLYTLVEGGGFSAAALLTIIGALLVTGSMFALMTHERKREFGLLKAMGAQNTFVFKLIMGEAALLGSAGAALGLGVAAICLLCVHTGMVLHEAPFALSTSIVVLRDMCATMIAAVLTAVLTALWPAVAATRMEPYAAIRGGE